MRIAVITGTYPKWSEQFIRREMTSLANRGHEIFIWQAEGEPREWLSPNGTALCHTTPHPELRPSLLKALCSLASSGILQTRRFFSVKAALERLPLKPEIILAQFTGLPTVIGRATAKAVGCPFVVSAHAKDIWVPWAPGLNAASKAEAVTFCNEAAKKRFIKTHPQMENKCFLIRHGLELDNFDMAPYTNDNEISESAQKIVRFLQEGKGILFCGRFIEKKGLNYLTATFLELAKKEPNIRLALVGKDELPQKQLRTVTESSQCKIFSPVAPEEIPAILKAAKVLTIPSVVANDGDRDGVPNIILEAFAAGTPVVASDAGGIAEAVNNDTGVLIPQHDATAIKDGILSVLTNHEKAERLSENARRFVTENYDSQKNIIKLEQLLQKTIERYTSPASRQ